MNVPDCWVILVIESQHYGKVPKLMSGWYGGYGGSDEWKLNSGITKIVKDGDCLIVHGFSGSTYKCYKETERASGLMLAVITNYQTKLKELNDGSSITLISYNEYKELNKNVTYFNID